MRKLYGEVYKYNNRAGLIRFKRYTFDAFSCKLDSSLLMQVILIYIDINGLIINSF